MKKIIYSVLLTCILGFLSNGKLFGQDKNDDKFPYNQEEPRVVPSIKDRLFYGGNIGLQFGSLTQIEIAPVVGFWVLPRVAVALGPTYRYYKDQYNATAIYGGKGYMELVIVQDLNKVLSMGVHTGIFFHIEDELLSLKTSYWKLPPYNESDRFNVNTILIGGGISQQIGRRSSLNFTLLWPLNQSVYSLYSNPEIRISFNF